MIGQDHLIIELSFMLLVNNFIIIHQSSDKIVNYFPMFFFMFLLQWIMTSELSILMNAGHNWTFQNFLTRTLFLGCMSEEREREREMV